MTRNQLFWGLGELDCVHHRGRAALQRRVNRLKNDQGFSPAPDCFRDQPSFEKMPAMHSYTSRSILGASLLLCILILSAFSHRVSVESINRDPGRFHDKEITVAGRVANSFEVTDAGAFELDDGTGRLWVFRNNTNLPAHNSSVTVTGRIEQGFTFGGRTFVIILRETRKRR
jgi:hypothetical protein